MMYRRNFFRREPLKLLSLPQELLCEIAKLTNSNGLLALALTCKLLNSVTKCRSLWLSLVTDIEADSCVPRTLERVVEDYTSQELQNWVLRRLRVRECLACSNSDLESKTTTIVRTPREFQRDRRVKPIKLLPGGRWMISLNSTCTQVYAYDLESSYYQESSVQQHKLFDVGQIDEEDGTLDLPSSYAIWFDDSASKSEGISFRILLWRIARPEEYHVTRTFIYQVYSSRCAESWSLKARRLDVLRSHTPVERPAMAISNKYLVELRKPGPEDLELVLYEYGDGIKKNECRQVFNPISLVTDAHNPFEVHITPQNQIITLSEESIEIYSLSHILDSSDRVRPQTLAPLQHIHLRLNVTYFSGPFLFAGISWIVAAHKNNLILTKIPVESADQLTVSTGLKKNICEVQFVPREYMTRIGPRASVFLRHDWSLDIVSYSWDVDTMVPKFRITRVEGIGSELHHGQARGWFIWDFDMELGRIVLFHTSTDNCMIVDI